MKILELEYDNCKVKSFENEIAINLFLLEPQIVMEDNLNIFQ